VRAARDTPVPTKRWTISKSIERKAKARADASVAAESSSIISRRGMLAAKALFTVGEAFVFPWATEGATRPQVRWSIG